MERTKDSATSKNSTIRTVRREVYEDCLNMIEEFRKTELADGLWVGSPTIFVRDHRSLQQVWWRIRCMLDTGMLVRISRGVYRVMPEDNWNIGIV